MMEDLKKKILMKIKYIKQLMKLTKKDIDEIEELVKKSEYVPIEKSFNYFELIDRIEDLNNKISIYDEEIKNEN